MVYDGSGDDVIDIQKPGGPSAPALLYVRGNAESRHFAVKGYDATGSSTGLLVNTTDPYEGVRPLDFMQGEFTSRLEISANGPWYIEVRPISSARVIQAPGTIEGIGDDVFRVSGRTDTATIRGNDASRHFAVIVYGDERRRLVVNTTDPYDGRVIVGQAIMVEVDAEGPWAITFE